MWRIRGASAVALALVLLAPATAAAQFKTPKPIGDLPQRPVPGSPAVGESGVGEEPEAPEPEEPLRPRGLVPEQRPARPLPKVQPPAGPQATLGIAAPAADAGVSEGTPVPALEVATVVQTPKATPASIAQAWRARQKALAELDFRTAKEREQEIAAARDELALPNLFSVSAALVREAKKLLQADPSEALRRADLAARLSPDLPPAHFAVARATFAASATDVGHIASALRDAAAATLRDERARRPTFIDLFAALAGALVLSTVVVVPIVFARHARCFFHDVRHLFPRGVSVVQTAVVACLILATPLVFRAGPFAMLATLALAAWFYMSTSERAVVTVLLAAVAAVPTAADIAAESLGSSELTDDVYLVERAGFEASPAAERLRPVAAEDSPPVAVLAALGRYERRFGRYREAVELLTRAAQRMPGSAAVLVELGYAQFLDGNLEGARMSFTSAVERDPGLAEGLFNLSVVFARKAQVNPAAALDLERSRSLAQKAAVLSPSVERRLGAPEERRANHVLESVALPPEAWEGAAVREVERGVGADLARRLLGEQVPWMEPYGPLAALVAFWLLLSLRRAARPSSECTKCGRPVCRRCDRDVGGGALCGQCVTVFASRRGAAEPAARVAKEIGIHRYRRRQESLSRAVALLVAGAGHLWNGRTVRGTLWLAGFVFFAFILLFRYGVARAPIGADGVLLRSVPVALALVAVYLLSLRGVFSGQSGRG